KSDLHISLLDSACGLQFLQWRLRASRCGFHDMSRKVRHASCPLLMLQWRHCSGSADGSAAVQCTSTTVSGLANKPSVLATRPCAAEVPLAAAAHFSRVAGIAMPSLAAMRRAVASRCTVMAYRDCCACCSIAVGAVSGVPLAKG